jgi:hypothetical protein
MVRRVEEKDKIAPTKIPANTHGNRLAHSPLRSSKRISGEKSTPGAEEKKSLFWYD